MDLFRTIIIPADQADLARTLAATLDPAHSAGMFETPLSATGEAPATHYISTGFIGQGFAGLVPLATWAQQPAAQDDEPPEWVQIDYQPGNSATLLALCEKEGVTVTLEEIYALFAGADVTEQDPWTAIGRLGLMIVQPEGAQDAA
jgi:hypothetical protein